MNKQELRQGRIRLANFLEPLLSLMGRVERRNWGAFYVQGVLLEGGRKTASGIAKRLGGDQQALQQFLNQSPWEWTPVRRELARHIIGVVSPRCAWIIDDTGFPKKGAHSVGVARQYSGTLGKIGNCQIAASLNYATDEACFPLDFTLYLPKEWLDDPARRLKAGIPEDTIFLRKWELALEMIDRAIAWGIPPGVIVADAGYGVSSHFRESLRNKKLTYVVSIQAETVFWLNEQVQQAPPYQGVGRPRTRARNLPGAKNVIAIAKSLPETAWQEITWREGTKGPLGSRFAAIRAQAAHGHIQRLVTEPMGWLLIEWPFGEDAPTKYWISNLPEDIPLRDLVYWAKMRWWIEQNYQQLKDQLGLDHFEGRSWTGWHHHVTLTMIAYGFLVLEKLRLKKNFWVDSPHGSPGDAAYRTLLLGFLSDLWEKAEKQDSQDTTYLT